MEKLKKGYLYALPNPGRISWGTYLGENSNGLVFCGSQFANDANDLNGIVCALDVLNVVEVAPGEHLSQAEALRLLAKVLP